MGKHSQNDHSPNDHSLNKDGLNKDGLSKDDLNEDSPNTQTVSTQQRQGELPLQAAAEVPASSARPAEIVRYNALAAQWWQADGPMWPLHKLNALRAPYVVARVCEELQLPAESSQPLHGLRILDIGCGAGLLSEAMARQGAQVTGIDPAERNIAIAREHAIQQGLTIDYRVGALEALVDEPVFDVVLNMEVVEHVEGLRDFMALSCAHVRPGGLQFVATLNRNPLSFVVAIVGAEYILRWLPRGTHQWRKFVKPAELDGMLVAGGQTVLDRRGVSVNPFTRGYSLTDFLGVNYMLVSRRGI